MAFHRLLDAYGAISGARVVYAGLGKGRRATCVVTPFLQYFARYLRSLSRHLTQSLSSAGWQHAVAEEELAFVAVHRAQLQAGHLRRGQLRSLDDGLCALSRDDLGRQR